VTVFSKKPERFSCQLSEGADRAIPHVREREITLTESYRSRYTVGVA